MLPLQLISGIYFPASQLPDWLHTVASLFPLVHLTNALQHAFLPGGATIAWADLGVMALWAVGARRGRRAHVPLAAEAVAPGGRRAGSRAGASGRGYSRARPDPPVAPAETRRLRVTQGEG